MDLRCMVGRHDYRGSPSPHGSAANSGRAEIEVECTRCGRTKVIRLDLSRSAKPTTAVGPGSGFVTGTALGGHSSPGSGL
jgi:hypothetical protein